MPEATTERLRHWVHYSLLSGLIVSGMLLIAGLVLVLARQEPRVAGPPPGLVETIRGVSAGRGVAMLDLGLLVLMITPLLRVAVLALGWGLARQWHFAAIALTVLLLLGLSVLLGVG